MTREDEINGQAAAFHAAHPNVRVLFTRFTLEMLRRGFRHYGAKSIFERIRWETDEADGDGVSTFKINNNYTAWYARQFMESHPAFEGFFRTRSRVSAKKAPTDLPELTPAHFD